MCESENKGGRSSRVGRARRRFALLYTRERIRGLMIEGTNECERNSEIKRKESVLHVVDKKKKKKIK